MADNIIKSEYFLLDDGNTLAKFIPPQAEETVIGGIKAAPKTVEDIREIKIDPTSGKPYVKPGMPDDANTELSNYVAATEALLTGKLNKNHTTTNSGKLLSVDENGNTKYIRKPRAVYKSDLRGIKIVYE